MFSWLKNLQRHFTPGDAVFDEPGKCDAAFSCKRVLLLLGTWLILWGVWQSLCIGNAAIDVAENIAWGQNFDWGYDKNPYFGAWISYAIYWLFHDSLGEYVFYFVSQFSAMLGVFSVYLIARDIFKSRFTAFLVVPLALLIPYFSHSSSEFNDDMISIALYGLTGLFFYRSVKRSSTGSWLVFGLCAGLALMTKYLAAALLFPLGLLLLITPEGRACWKKPGIYLGAAICILLVLPNLFWIFGHDFIAIKYAFSRANLQEMPDLSDHFIHFLEACGDYVVMLFLPWGALFLLSRGKNPGFPKFDRLFIFAAGLGPMTLSALFALITGGEVNSAWLTPYFVFAPLLLVFSYRPVPTCNQMKRFTALVIIFTVMAMLTTANEYLHDRPYVRNNCSHQVYPGKKVAKILTKEWHDRFARPCPYVIGKRTDSCFFCYYSPDHPRAFFDNDRSLSQWIDPEDIRKQGAIIVWSSRIEPDYLKQYPGALRLPTIKLERQIPPWFRAIVPISPKKDDYQAVIVPPSSFRPEKTAP